MTDALLYTCIGLFTFIEGGELALFFAGYLVHMGKIDFLPSAGIILIALVSGDYVAYRYGHCFFQLPLIRQCNKYFAVIDEHITKRPLLVAFVARFSYGFHHITLARYQSLGIQPRTMVRILISTACTWLVVLGGSLVTITWALPVLRHYVHMVEILFALGFLVLLFVQIVFTTFIRHRMFSDRPDNDTD